MTIRDNYSIGSLLLALSMLLVPAASPQAATKVAPRDKSVAIETRPALEPKAIDLLKAASSRLAAAHSMSFTAVVTYESPSRLGHPLSYTTKSEVTL
jgi:hypothetical protein